MDAYSKSITLDVNAEDNYKLIKVKQNDILGRQIAITLQKDGVAFTPSGVSETRFRVERPDGTEAMVNSGIEASGNVYTVTLTDECLAVAGKALCDLAFLDASGNALSSETFIMKIIPVPIER